jgi:MFS family permease
VAPERPAHVSRIAVTLLFFVNGFGFGTWVAHLPLFKSRLGLSDGLLGIALLGAALASLVFLPLAGVLIARVGSRVVCAASGVAACLALAAPFFAPNYLALVAAAVTIGGAFSVFDVAINAQAVAVEAALARPSMSSFHAAYSFGGLAGSALSAVLIARRFPFSAGGVLVAATCFALVVAAYPYLASDSPARTVPGSAARAPRGPRRALVLLGVLAFLGLVGEGAMADWTGVYLHSSLGIAAAGSAVGFGAFSIAMALGRASGDWLVARLGPRRAVAGGSAFAALALGAALVLHTAWAAYLGFACVGLGLANVIPVLFSAAGRSPGFAPGVGIALVSTVGYGGFVIGPPAIGFTSDAVGIRLALGLVVASIGAISLLTRVALPRAAAKTS